jgi:hypothetical protein
VAEVAFEPHHLEVGVGCERHSEALRDQDRRRSWELQRILREEGFCQDCKRKLSEARMERKPGCCSDCEEEREKKQRAGKRRR